MDNIKSQLDKLAELSDEQVGELEASITSEFDTFAEADLTPQSVESMSELADMLDTVRGEVARREAQAEELAVRAAEAAARVRGEEPADESEESEEDADEDDEAVTASAETEEEEAPVNETPSEPATETEASIEEVETEAPAEAEASIEEAPAEDAEVPAPAETEAESAPAEDEAPAEAEAEEVVDAPVTTEAEASAEAEDATEEVATETELSADEAEVEVPAEAEASNSDETPSETEESQEEAQTVTASADESFEAPADRRPVAQAPVAPTVAITAGADIPGVTAGSTISDMSGVAKAFADRLHTLRRANGGDGEQHTVAQFSTEYTEDRILEGSPEENWNKIEKAGEERQALVASGGYGTPVETRYDIFGFGTDARPVRDSLPKFQANRGGIRFVRPPVLSSYANAVGVWTEADDIAAASNDGDGDTVKNVLTVAGATEATAKLDAVTLQLQIGNLLSRAYPELVARHNELALIQHAREAELNLLAKIDAASTAVTTTSIIGFARDFLVQVKRAAAAYRSRHRIAPDTRLQAIIPMWVYDAMAADLTLNMPGDQNLDVTKGEIQSFLALSNVSLTASYDQNTFGAQSTGALLEFPDSFTWFLFSEGSFLFLDGGTLDIGIVRDSTLVGTNDYRMFVETFEGLAFVGIESLAITSTINVNGAAAALRDTLGGVSASTIEY